jgi:hypothetical protein
MKVEDQQPMQEVYPQYFELQIARAIADLDEAQKAFEQVAKGMSERCLIARQTWLLAMANIRSALGLAMALSVVAPQDWTEIERAFITAEL